MLNKKFLHIPLWRWFLILVLFVGASFNSYDYIKFYTHTKPGLFNIVLHQANDIKELCFILPFAWFLIIGDINIYDKPSSKTNQFYYLIKNLLHILLINLAVIASLFLINSISLLINTGTISLWSGNPVLNGFPTVLISLLFLFLRFIFFSLVICLLNINLKNPFGILGVIIINLMDWKFYSIFNIMQPLGVLPIEHTRIYYTEALAPMAPGDSRFSFGISFAYWGIIILFLIIMIFLSLKKSTVKEDSLKETREVKNVSSGLDLKIQLTNKGYIAGFAILILSTFISLINNLRFDIFKDLSTLGADNLFVFSMVSNPFIEVLVPIIPSLIILGAINIKNNHMLVGSNKNNNFSKILYIIILGGSVFVIASIIILFVFLVISPSIGSPLYEISGLFSSFYSNSKLLYIGLYLIHSFAFGGIFAVFSYSIYYYSKNKFNTIILPLLLYRASTYIPIIQNSNINSYLNVVVPVFPYEIIGFQNSVWINTCQLVLIFSVSLLLLNIKEKKLKEKTQ